MTDTEQLMRHDAIAGNDEALLAITATVSSTLDLREGLRRICRELTRLLGADTGAAYLHDVASDQLTPVAGYHVPKDLLSTLLSEPLPLREQAFYVPLWKDRRPIFSADVAADSRFSHELFRLFRHQAGFLLPLVLDDAVVGAFYLVWWTACPDLTERARALADTVAAQAATMLRNARLFEEAQRERRHLELMYEVARRLAAVHDTAELLTLLVNEASALLDVEAAAIRLIEGDDLVIGARTESAVVLTARLRIKIWESLSGQIVATGEPVMVEDLVDDTRYDAAHKLAALEQGFHGFLGVPLKLHGRVIGTLNVYTKARRRFRADEVSLLSGLADQASLAIHKARLLQEAEDARRVVEGLHRVAVSMQACPGRDEQIEAFARGVHEAVGFDRISVLLRTDDGSRLELVTAFGDEASSPPLSLPLSLAAGPFFQVVKTRRALAVLEERDLKGVQPLRWPYTEDPYFRSKRFVAAPLTVGHRVLGVAVADNKRSRRPIPRASIEPFSLLCQQLALMLDNGRNYEAMRTQQTRLAQIFDSTSDGIVLVSLSGRIDAANRRAGELLGVDPDAMLGREIGDLMTGHSSTMSGHDRAVAALVSVVAEPDREAQGDVELRQPARFLHWVAQPTRSASGATLGVTLTFQDVTHEREVSQMKSDFVSFVTHQLRTPLAGIKWMLELASQEADVPPDAGSYVQDARDAAQRLIVLVNDLLDISRLERGKLTIAAEAVDLDELTRGVLGETALLAQERGHRIFVSAAETLPAALADPQLVRQVVLNLVSNAIKYTPSGGGIVIWMDHEADLVRWSIKDTGIGIPASAQARLFEKFYRADNVVTIETEGTGLGLYLVRLIMEQLGGRVWCESREGEGSTFAFTLPCAR